MKNFLLLLVAVGVIWLCWQKFSKDHAAKTPGGAAEASAPAVAPTPTPAPTPKPTPTPLTPEQEIQKALMKPPLSAATVVAIVEKYPDLAPSLLQGRNLKIQGTIKRIRVFGMENDQAEIVLEGTPQKTISFQVPVGTGSGMASEKWVLEAGRLYRKGRGTGSTRALYRSEGENITESGVFQQMTPTGLQFKLAN